MDAFWIILTGSLVAISCGTLGCYLVLRKMAMVGDAISHAVLPGIVLAFLFSGSRDPFTMLLGAGAVGLLSTFLIETIHRRGQLQEDASIGVVFTFLFAVGVILISMYAGQVDLDQDCVLYGEIAYVPLDLLYTKSGASLGPRTVWILGGVLLAVIALVSFAYKELAATTFDSQFAAAIGISTTLWHYALMGAVSLTTVASFESVGAVLVVAFLVIPPATAFLLTDKLPVMLGLSAVVGILSAAGGYALAVAIDGSIAGAMAVVGGAEFALALLFSPRYGIPARIKRKTHEELPSVS